MFSRYSWIALGLGAYVAFVISSIPASTVYRFFGPAELRLAGLEGTLWSGGAALGSVEGLSLHDIRWNLAPLPLLTGRASGNVEARLPDGFAAGEVSATPSRIILRGVEASTSLPALGNLLPAEGVRGLVSLALDELRLDDGRPTKALGRVRIAELAVPPLMPGAGAELIPLGNYEIVFKDAGGAGIAAEIHDTGGPLEVAAELRLDDMGNYTLEGVAAAREDASKELVQGLKLMTGEPDAEGRRPFSLTGSL
jgi:general secretion pathway protein N